MLEPKPNRCSEEKQIWFCNSLVQSDFQRHQPLDTSETHLQIQPLGHKTLFFCEAYFVLLCKRAEGVIPLLPGGLCTVFFFTWHSFWLVQELTQGLEQPAVPGPWQWNGMSFKVPLISLQDSHLWRWDFQQFESNKQAKRMWFYRHTSLDAPVPEVQMMIYIILIINCHYCKPFLFLLNLKPNRTRCAKCKSALQIM